jgi:hypothetical protein
MGGFFVGVCEMAYANSLRILAMLEARRLSQKTPDTWKSGDVAGYVPWFGAVDTHAIGGKLPADARDNLIAKIERLTQTLIGERAPRRGPGRPTEDHRRIQVLRLAKLKYTAREIGEELFISTQLARYYMNTPKGKKPKKPRR